MTSRPDDLNDLDLAIQAGRRLAAGGLSPGSSGNLSVRTGSRVLVTRRGADLAQLTPDDIVEVDLVRGLAAAHPESTERVGRASPTKELAMHAAVYRSRPQARAIVHVHSHYATAVSCLPATADGGADLPSYTPYRVMRLGRVPLVAFAPPGGADLAEAVGVAAEGAHALLLAHHGSLIAAQSMDDAVADAFELEAAARLTLELRGLGAPELSTAGWARLRP